MCVWGGNGVFHLGTPGSFLAKVSDQLPTSSDLEVGAGFRSHKVSLDLGLL